jgi:hypothetical protein
MDYEIRRSVADIQSKIASLDHRVLRMTAGTPGNPQVGDRFFKLALASLYRLRGDHERAERLEQRAAVNPARTDVSGWAAELAGSTAGGLLLAITKQSAYATLAARTQPFDLRGNELPKLVVGGEIVVSFVAQGEPIGVQSGSLSPLTINPRKILAIVVFSEELLSFGINVLLTSWTVRAGGAAFIDPVSW